MPGKQVMLVPLGKYPMLRPARTTKGGTKRKGSKAKVVMGNRYASPGGSHGRAEPYEPTTQLDGHYRFERGNAPRGEDVNYTIWSNVFNTVNCKIHKTISAAAAKEARLSGRVRDLAIDKLIEDGRLSYNYIDDDI